jgi:membrane protein DedA with SNARE-associated domain
MTVFLALLAGTFVSEDLACITAGVLIQRGQIGVVTGVAGCAAGIFIGDFGLWAIGRVFGRVALSWPWLARRMGSVSVRDLQRWIERHAAGAIVASRFLPGTRVPLYVVAGVVRLPGALFAFWALAAALLWTPSIVLLTAALGDRFVSRLFGVADTSWAGRIGGVFVLGLGLRRLCRLLTAERRRQVSARVRRWSRWEFWPMWLFYSPVAVWVALLAIRYRGVATLTAANPGMADGGTVGESKAEILRSLPCEWTIPFALIDRGDVESRLAALERARIDRAWAYPLILKPDVGQRGVGVKLVKGEDEAREYLLAQRAAVVAQPYHPGPFEAGVFYYRFPHWPTGRILSITDKRFPFVVGDGASTLEELIWQHPRYRLQATTFLARHRRRLLEVPAAGEAVQLAIAGNHAQGTLFCDGEHLRTPALERRIDEIARCVPGFFVGRFDIRYGDVERFKTGDDLAIVELNGATSESTNIYDPSGSLLGAYRTLCRQWSLVFAIADANRRRGARVTPFTRLVSLVRMHWRSRVAFELAD